VGGVCNPSLGFCSKGFPATVVVVVVLDVVVVDELVVEVFIVLVVVVVVVCKGWKSWFIARTTSSDNTATTPKAM